MEKNYNYYADLAEEAIELGDANLAEEFLGLANEVQSSFSPPTPAAPVDPVDFIPEPTVAEDYVAPVPEEEGKGFLGTVAEVPVNMLGAVGSFAKETVGTVIDWPAEALTSVTGDITTFNKDDATPEQLQLYNDAEGTRLFSIGSTDFKYVNPDQLQALKEANFYSAFKFEEVVEDLVFDLGDARDMGMQETFVGGATGGLTQFIAGWMALAPVKVLSIARNATVATQVGKAALKGAVVDFTVFDAHEARLADFLKSTGLEADWINYLASEGNEDDSIFEGKMKNAIEGGVLGTGLDITFRTVGYGYRAIRKAKRAQDPSLTQAQRDEAAAEAVELQSKAEESFKDPSEVELVSPEGTPVKVETPETVAVKFEEKVGTVVDTLPPELQKAAPRYNYGQTPIELEFENDIAKALYIVGGKGKSASHDQYIKFLEDAGVKDIKGEAAKIRKLIKEQAKAGNTEVTVPKVKPRVKYTQGFEEPVVTSTTAKPRVDVDIEALQNNWTSKAASDAVEYAAGYPNGAAKAMVSKVDPQSFVNATAPDPAYIAKNARELNVAELLEETQPIFITIKDGKIVGHEGRHRMQALANAGITDIPIQIRFADGATNVAESMKLNGQKFDDGSEALGSLDIKDPILAKLANEDKIASIGGFNRKVSKADPSKPRVDAEGNTVESRSPQNMTDAQLDLATKADREKLGSLRSPDDVGDPKVVPIKDTVELGNKLIAKLLRDSNADDIQGFVKSLREMTIRPDGFEPAQWVKALGSLNKSIDEALALVDDSVEFKAGDETAILRKTKLVEAKLDLHAQRKASSSGLGRGLVAIKQAFDDAFSADLSTLFGKDLEKAQAKVVEKDIKKQKEKNKKKTEKEKTDIDKAAEESDLTPSAVDELDPFTKRMLDGLGRTKEVASKGIDKIVEYGSANLLMGWKTQLINPTMNAVMMKLNNFETFGGALWAGVVRRDKSAALRQARRAKYQSFSVVNHSRVATRAMWETLMTGYNKLDPDFKVKEEVDGATDTVAIGKGDIDFRKWKESLNEGMTFEDILGNYIRLSYRGLAAGDEFFKQLNFRGVYGGLVQEDLLASGKYVDLDDATFMKLLDSKIDEGVEVLEKARLGEEALDEAEEKLLGQLLYSLQQTREATFTDKLGGVGSWIQKGMNEFPILRLGMDAWFIRTPLNVFKYVGRRTPVLNLASRRSRRMLFGGNSDDRDRALFELTFMTSAMLTLRQVVDEEVDVPDGKGGTIKMHRYQGTMDHLTFNNVKNLKLTGLQPHSVFFEDSQTFHNTMRFAPIDNLVMTLVNIRDLENAGMYDEGGELAAAALVSYINMMKDTTFTSGMANFVEFMNNPERKFENYVEAKGRTFTPAALKMMGTDTGGREVDGLWDSFKSSVPFMSKTMEPKFDRLGQPVVKPDQSGIINGLSKATFLSNDPVRMEFLDMNADIADIPRKDGILDWESDAFVVDGKSAWWRFNEVYATIELGDKTLEEQLEALVLSDEYQDIATPSIMTPDLRMRGSKEALILKVLNAYEDAAKYTVAKEREDLGMLEMWTAAQQARALSQSQQTMDQVVTKPETLLDTFLNRNK